MRRSWLTWGIALIAAATLMFELTLMRLFAVAEWYHFAFLCVSVALLGYASSGTLLALIPLPKRTRWLPGLGVAFAASIVGAYLILNHVPFDSYQLAWDRRQIVYLGIYYLGLVVPFALSGLLVANGLAREAARSHVLYAANLVGSALGGLALVVSLPALGEKTVLVAGSVGAAGAVCVLLAGGERDQRAWGGALCAGLLAVVWVALLALNPPWLALRLSPYKSLSYVLRTSDAHLSYRQWNLFARVDLVQSPHIHSAPGLSLKYMGQLPPQYGLTVDGGDLSPLTRNMRPADTDWLAYLPSGLPYQLRAQATALIVQPRGGLDVAVALQHNARQVTVVEDNPLILYVVRDLYGAYVGELYRDPRVMLTAEDGRSLLQRRGERYDIIQFSLAEAYHPLQAGSYSLAENYIYTTEALTYALGRLTPGGLLVITRWLQDQPSEAVRAAALMVTALERVGVQQAAEHLLAYRSWSTVTLLASPQPFTAADTATLRAFCDRLGFDPVYYPGLQREEANRYNRLPRLTDYEALQGLLATRDRRAFYRAQTYDVTPPSDDRPFFGHLFRWQQIPQVIAQWGRSWQPFGGSGFLLVLALLGIALLAAAALALLPLLWLPPPIRRNPGRGALLIYFAALGLGYMLLEMPLMQQFILYLGQPTRAFILVLATLLLASGLGSLLATRVRLGLALLLLVLVILGYPWLLAALFKATLSLTLAARTGIAVLCLAPLGLLMGLPFAGGMHRAAALLPGSIPWIWAINGSASVVSSILATVLALSWGYRVVLTLAALCYLVAALAYRYAFSGRRSTAQRQRPSGSACGSLPPGAPPTTVPGKGPAAPRG